MIFVLPLDKGIDINQSIHLDDFICSRIIDKLEEGHSIRDVDEFGIVKNVIRWLWKDLYEVETCTT